MARLKRRGGIVQLQRAQGAAIERVERIRPRGDRPVEGIARLRQLAILEVKVAQLLQIAQRGVVPNQSLQLLDAFAARKHLERWSDERKIGRGFGDQVDQRADRPDEKNDVEPVRVRPAADEVQDGERLEDQSPGVEKVSELSHGYASFGVA
jgi:hypothetical protein